VLQPVFTRHSSFILRCSCYLHGCKCGFFGAASRECRCTPPGQIQQCLGKISGPLLDRIDIHVEVPAVPYQELRGGAPSESSAEIRERVERARAVQRSRGYYNSRMPARLIRKECALDASGERTLEMAVRRMGLSARAHDRILKVARTIADIGGSPEVGAKHVAEAVQYRSLDRNYWT
jgi:magnesium chelatase family protein